MNVRWAFTLCVPFLIVCSAGRVSGQVSGNGTANTVPRWTSATTLGDSPIKTSTDRVGIGSLPTFGYKLKIVSPANDYAVVQAEHPSSGIGVRGVSLDGTAIQGRSTNGAAVNGFSDTYYGVFGRSVEGHAIGGLSDEGHGLRAGTSAAVSQNDPWAAGVYGYVTAGSSGAYAGIFSGNVKVTGTLEKGGGSFKIDHPLDPENKYLYHSFVESPDMMNIYNGNVTTDQNGEALVELPDYFEALNRDFRYQLTVLGVFAQAIVGEEVKGNRFKIRTSAPNVKVSWQVTGIRQDAFANKYRIPVEEPKPEIERGLYLHPLAFDQPEIRSIRSVRDRESMSHSKEQ